MELACGDPNYSTACTLIGEYGLTEALSGGNWTVFAPTNAAFEAIASVLPSLGDETVKDILLFHTISDKVVTSSDLVCTGLQHMTNGRDSRTVCRGDSIYQRGAGNDPEMLPLIITADLPACNGVVHTVDNVMLPPL